MHASLNKQRNYLQLNRVGLVGINKNFVVVKNFEQTTTELKQEINLGYLSNKKLHYKITEDKGARKQAFSRDPANKDTAI